jgi:hypothetical protein
MRYIIITWTILAFSSCTYERIYISDVEGLLSNQLENNLGQIENIKTQIKEYKIEKIKKNTLLIERLERIHSDLLALNDSIDSLEKGEKVYKANGFISRHFDDLKYYQKAPLELPEETPGTLIKLHLATLEGFYLKEHEGRYSFEDYRIALDRLQPVIVPDKIVYRRNEKITGRIMLMSTTDDPEQLVQNAKVIKKMEINGTEIANEKGLGKFEIQNSKAVGELVLTTIVTLPDTIMKSETTIYVRD